MGELLSSLELIKKGLTHLDECEATIEGSWGAERHDDVWLNSVKMMRHFSFYSEGETVFGNALTLVEGMSGAVGLMLQEDAGHPTSVKVLTASRSHTMVLERVCKDIPQDDLHLLAVSLGLRMSEGDI